MVSARLMIIFSPLGSPWTFSVLPSCGRDSIGLLSSRATFVQAMVAAVASKSDIYFFIAVFPLD